MNTSLDAPETWLCDAQASTPVYLDCTDADLRDARPLSGVEQSLGRELVALLPPGNPIGHVLMKVHVGERKCTTRMRPGFVRACGQALTRRGAAGVVAGDTTVAYTGPRSHRSNTPSDCSAYLALAADHGWSRDGDAGMPFVVLDRPGTSVAGGLAFAQQEIVQKIDGIERFSDFCVAGGVAAADLVVNHAHLTLHGLAGFAGCVKSLAMGCTSLKGKLRMHQALHPHADPERCTGCGLCVKHCPEDALRIEEERQRPVVDAARCIGCGECVSVCPRQALRLEGEDIHDWSRGAETISRRMVDYTMGLMNGRWARTLHVLHMIDITRLCDCVDLQQKPILDTQPGFLLGWNPFDIDRWGAEIVLRLGRRLDPAAKRSLRQAIAS